MPNDRKHTSTARRHAAIMFTDIVGYTALMGSDEDRAFEVLSKNREIHTELVEQYNGTLIKEIGDGMLVSFNLASDAVYCAIEIQRKSKEQDIPLKIGIHEGEMVFEGADVLGDAVNVASRLEAETHEGCIHISGSVYRDIKNKSDIRTKYIREKRFKNVDEPIRVYKIEVDASSDSFEGATTKTKKRPVIIVAGLVLAILLIYSLVSYLNNEEHVASSTLEKSIAVLPFDNLGTSTEHQYYIDGIVEDILTKLSTIRELRVISNTTSGNYKDTEKSVPEIAEELNVNYIVEGSGRVIGDQLKVTVQLIEASTDKHIWAMDTIVVLQNILTVQNDIAANVTSKLKINLSLQEEQTINSDLTDNPMAYEYYLKSHVIDDNYYLDSFDIGLQLVKKAVELDENFDQAWAELSELYSWKISFGGSRNFTLYLDSANHAVKKALEINPFNSYAYYAKAIINQNLSDQELTFLNLKKAYELGSTHPMVFWWLSNYYRNRSNHKESSMVVLDGLSRSLIYDPGSHEFYTIAGWSFIKGLDLVNAEKILKKGVNLFPESVPLNNGLRVVNYYKRNFNEEKKFSKFLYEYSSAIPAYTHWYAQCLLRDKNYRDAEELFEEYISGSGHFSVTGGMWDAGTALYELGFVKIKLGKETEGRKYVQEYIDLRTGNKNYIKYDLARCHAILGNMDEAYKYLTQANTYKIWYNYEDPILEDINPPAEITDYIEAKVKEYEIERENAVEIFREMYEKLIAAGKLKRIEDYL